MDEQRDSELQLNKEAPAVEQFSLEDILREFGGWTKPEEPEEPAPVPEPEPPAEPDVQPESEIMRVAASEKQEKPSVSPLLLSGDTVRFSPVGEPPEPEPPVKTAPVEMPEEPEPVDREQLRENRKAQQREAKRLQRLNVQRRKAMRAARRAAWWDEPDASYPSPEEACDAYARAGTLRIRLLLSGLMTLFSGMLLVLSVNPVGPVDLTGKSKLFSVMMLAILLGQSLLSVDVLIKGVYQALKMRFDLTSLLVLGVVVTALDSFAAIPGGRIPFCTVCSLSLLVALRSMSLEKKAKWRTLKTVLSMKAPCAAVKEEKAWRELDCIFRQEGSLEDFTAMLETPDAAKKAMRVYAPVAAALTLVLAGLAAAGGSGSFLWAWAGLLGAAVPVGGFLCCSRPFSILAKRLGRMGVAICGWRGAKILSGEGGLVITDNDVFPPSNIAMNGMKMYSDLPVRQVVGYAAAVLEAAGSGLLPLFEEVVKNENARRYTVDTFRQYEGGGLGAEIRGDVVLLGSLAFMRLMGVQIPGGTRVQSAVYISVNKELTGVFALTYTPVAAARTGLQNVLRSAGLTPVLATRDFMITPGLVKKRYKVSVDRLEYPVVAERAQLSAPEAGAGGIQGALMDRGSFGSFAAAVTGGRQLRRTVRAAMMITLLCGMVGICLLALLAYLGAETAASAFNLVLYQLIWLLPGLLITGMVGKS